MRLNWWGQDDDGFIVYESRAIGRYIAAKYSSKGTPLIPSELKAKAKFEEAASVETAHFDPPGSVLCYEKYYKGCVSVRTCRHTFTLILNLQASWSGQRRGALPGACSQVAQQARRV
jgi:hypothetical protein